MNEDSLAERVNGEEVVLIGKERAWDYVSALDVAVLALYEMARSYFPGLAPEKPIGTLIAERVVQKYKAEGYTEVTLRLACDTHGNTRTDLIAIYCR